MKSVHRLVHAGIDSRRRGARLRERRGQLCYAVGVCRGALGRAAGYSVAPHPPAEIQRQQHGNDGRKGEKGELYLGNFGACVQNPTHAFLGHPADGRLKPR